MIASVLEYLDSSTAAQAIRIAEKYNLTLTDKRAKKAAVQENKKLFTKMIKGTGAVAAMLNREYA